MTELFLTVLKMSLTASYVILCVIIVRLLLKKAPKVISYALWGVVAFRLVIPFSFESTFSLLPWRTNIVPVRYEVIYYQSPQVTSSQDAVNSLVNEPPSGKSAIVPVFETSINRLQNYIAIGTYIWLLGVMALLIYSLASFLKLKRQLKSAQLIDKNIYHVKNLKTPFVLGIIKPKIYLPFGLDDAERSYILIHEQTHINRRDHIIKILAFLILSVHWFNPLVWIAFMLMSTDMELSCDEKVLKEMGENIRKPYANSLLSLAAGRHILNGSALAFGEGNVKGRIKNVLNYKKFPFWVIAASVVTVIAVGIALASNPKPGESVRPEENEEKLVQSPEGTRVQIEFLSDNMGFKSAGKFVTDDSKILAYIDSTLRNSLTPSTEDDLENNHTNQYVLKLSNDTGEYSYKLYYDTLYNKAYIVKDEGLYEVSTDFARYIDSFLENTNINLYIDNDDAVELFKKYGWTLDYQISAMDNKLNNIKTLSGFNPNAYYFAYNNELSKDIGLDMSEYSNTSDIEVEIYRIYESMPKEFYPIQNCRGIVVKSRGKIIGAFISAGRHSTFNACSLKGNSFEKVAGKTFNEWLSNMILPDDIETRLSKLTPEQVIEEYFTALNKKDTELAKHCISKDTLLDNLTVNMANSELFNEGIILPLTGGGIVGRSTFDNLKSAKLLDVELIEEPDKNSKIFRVMMDLQYKKDEIIHSGKQHWDCNMIFETPQTGWKIKSFGH
ncbi:M56 family metallopeptidase [Acetivibrio straminisolvens]|jgi:beta-lactamase regulating signal transducer with metallopeptidase domain|uniref:Regulatory sensor-transducer n=1 Tax=Acetivibrio straminisolvens JCM 21531 TaxID=1294263 RepID=W4V495_9FIRM|nr:M56 family metallopeptidase [Acetivibrio straminisolvens]GAE88001.1 regulatory sensor-transducer [Acetivibrio straminisolvens JCM 21531]